MSQIAVGILGASGYGGGELLRLLTHHPHTDVVSLVARTAAGKPVRELHPHLGDFYPGDFSASLDLEPLLSAEHGVIFAALPHGTSATQLSALDAELNERGGANIRIIDLSGDFRLRDHDEHNRWYPDSPIAAPLRERFVYGLPEHNATALRTTTRIANPGCLATAAILAASPLGQLPNRPRLSLDLKTGSSGSGRSLKDATHHPTRHADLRAYGALHHRHEPEIQQALQAKGWETTETSFVVHSMDTTRGIFATVHAWSEAPWDAGRVAAAFESAYGACPFIRFVETTPTLQNVVGSNFVELSWHIRDNTLIVMATLDNLVKGMAGAAIQNMNLCCGLAETTGLWHPALRPL